jgi:hypothetical protein
MDNNTEEQTSKGPKKMSLKALLGVDKWWKKIFWMEINSHWPICLKKNPNLQSSSCYHSIERM